jgi:hypothetical protein
MSIDARVVGVEYRPDGTAELRLVPANPRRAPAGQTKLIVEDPPKHLDAMIGTEIWGPSSCIMVGTREVAERVTATRIRFNKPKGR